MTDRDDKTTTAEVNPNCLVCDNYGPDGMGCVGYPGTDTARARRGGARRSPAVAGGGRSRPRCFTEIPSGSGQFDSVGGGEYCPIEDAPSYPKMAAGPPSVAAGNGPTAGGETGERSTRSACPVPPRRAADRLSRSVAMGQNQHEGIVSPGAAATVAILLFLAVAFAPVDGSGPAFAPVDRSGPAFAPVKVFRASGAKTNAQPHQYSHIATDGECRPCPPLRRNGATIMVRSHPAQCDDLAAILGVDRRATSRKIADAEQLLELIVAAAGGLSTTGRPDRVATAIRERFQTIVRIARNGRPEDCRKWLDNVIADRQRNGRTHGRGSDAVRQKTATNPQALAIDVG